MLKTTYRLPPEVETEMPTKPTITSRLRHLALVPILYIVFAVATALPVIYALGWAVWGAPTSPLEFISLFGSVLLVFAAMVRLTNRRVADWMAVSAALCVASLYVTVGVSTAWAKLSDREINVKVLQFQAGRIDNRLVDISTISANRIPPNVIKTLEGLGISGDWNVDFNWTRGQGHPTQVLVLMDTPVLQRSELSEPDSGSIIYIQEGNRWRKIPRDAKTLGRKIVIQPLDRGGQSSNMVQDSVMIEDWSGASMGRGILWNNPKSSTP